MTIEMVIDEFGMNIKTTGRELLKVCLANTGFSGFAKSLNCGLAEASA
jgi:hypothetical protein